MHSCLHFFREEFFLCFSLGCGIGYGYLHRIPTTPFTEGKSLSVKHPVATPSSGDVLVDTSTPTTAPADGFSDVRIVP